MGADPGLGIDVPLVATNGRLNFLWGALFAGVAAAALGAFVALPLRNSVR